MKFWLKFLTLIFINAILNLLYNSQFIRNWLSKYILQIPWRICFKLNISFLLQFTQCWESVDLYSKRNSLNWEIPHKLSLLFSLKLFSVRVCLTPRFCVFQGLFEKQKVETQEFKTSYYLLSYTTVIVIYEITDQSPLAEPNNLKTENFFSMLRKIDLSFPTPSNSRLFSKHCILKNIFLRH